MKRRSRGGRPQGVEENRDRDRQPRRPHARRPHPIPSAFAPARRSDRREGDSPTKPGRSSTWIYAVRSELLLAGRPRGGNAFISDAALHVQRHRRGRPVRAAGPTRPPAASRAADAGRAPERRGRRCRRRAARACRAPACSR